MPAVVDVIDRARYIAKGEGRTAVEFEDLDRAIKNHVAPSELAKERTFSAPAKRGPRPSGDAVAAPHAFGSASATSLQADGRQAGAEPESETIPGRIRFADDLQRPGSLAAV
jgi:Mg-chelatase subunit ChlI